MLKDNSEKVLVTGGLGFIGSALIYYLNKLDITNIIICDRFRSQEKWKNIRNLSFSEIINPENIFKFLERNKIDIIYHLGACSNTLEADMDFLYQNNFEFSKKLFYYSLTNDSHFIYASSAATYGNAENYFVENQNIQQLTPINKYGFSKQLFDLWVKKKLSLWLKKIANAKPLILAGVKFFNVFGPNEYHKNQMASVVFHGFNQVKKDKKIRLFKSYRKKTKHGEQKRDFIYIKDVCQALLSFKQNLTIIQKNLVKSQRFIYNLGSSQASSFNKLAQAIFKVLKVKENIEYIDIPHGLKLHYQYYTQAEMDWGWELDHTKKENYLDNAVQDYLINFLKKESPYFTLNKKDHYS